MLPFSYTGCAQCSCLTLLSNAIVDRNQMGILLQERRRVVEQLQALAGERDIRITILCGGTGAAGVAQFYRYAQKVVSVHNKRE
jgi:molybdopterin biosynthesis enzyme MoaB